LRRHAQRLQYTLSPQSSLFVSVTAYVRGKALVSTTQRCAVNQHYEALALTRTACCAARLRSSGRSRLPVAPRLECSPRCARLLAAHTLSPWVCSPGSQSYGLYACMSLRTQRPWVLRLGAKTVDGHCAHPSHWHSQLAPALCRRGCLGSPLRLVIL